MTDFAIRAEGLGKRYRLGTLSSYKSLRETLMGFAGAGPRRAARAASETLWALKDVRFEIAPGQAVGIIGRNGAGKSTLLKVLSRITEPTEGIVDIHGRVGSLLEVGTGFHPELTGRENIYLNGAVLGMRKREIQHRFDEIVAFSEIERFIDTPVKHYSSGMYMRLAFSVAAHLEPDIFVIDEVLAVGDQAFQKKCLGKMGEVARAGRTVLFVSHNLGAIVRLCERCIWLEQGRVRHEGEATDVVARYTREGLTETSQRRWALDEQPGDDALRLAGIRICQPSRVPTGSVDISRSFDVEIETQVIRPAAESVIGLRVLTADGQVVVHTGDIMEPDLTRRPAGRWTTVCRLPAYALNAGTYVLSVTGDVPHVRMIFVEDRALTFTVEALSPQMARYTPGAWTGVVGPGLAEWSRRPVAIEREEPLDDATLAVTPVTHGA